ncbi:MAG: hypothetical protein J5634_01140 [Bacilli bacterium]|nr:hypothetical protein [Bacilli bacterium]
MEDYILPKYIIDSINYGAIYKHIASYLSNPESLKDKDFYIKHRDLLLIYIKAYIAYNIFTECNIDYNRHFDIKGDNEFSNFLFNFIKLRDSYSKVKDQILILLDVFESASKTDADIQAIYLKSQLDYKNLEKLKKDPRYEDLARYDNFITLAIMELSKDTKFNIEITKLIELCKCYIISKNDTDDEEYICGSSNFIYNVVNDAYSIYEQQKISYKERLSSRNSDVDKIKTLKRIIHANHFNN